MLHLLGVNLPDKKVVHVALTYFYGIGPTSARLLCDRLSIHREAKLQELTEPQINKLSTLLTDMTLESDLRRAVQSNIIRLRRINSYRGRRIAAGLPSRGQRTRTNAKTAKRLNGRWLNDVSFGIQSEQRRDYHHSPVLSVMPSSPSQGWSLPSWPSMWRS